MTADIAAIARGLTKAQREAVCGARQMYADNWVIPILRDVRTKGALIIADLTVQSDVIPAHILTPLGLAVRAHLMEKPQ